MKHNLNKEYFKNIDTEEKAYWLGFIAADGCVYKMSKNAYRLQINLSYKDIEHLELFNKCLESDYKINVKKLKNSDICELKIASKQLTDDLIELGITPNKSLKVEMPNIDIDLIPHFIRGYFDGDGCITYSETPTRFRYKFSIVGGESMLESINTYMNQDIEIYTINHSDALDLCTSNKQKIINIYHYLYDNANIYLTRKKEKFDYILSRFVGIQNNNKVN